MATEVICAIIAGTASIITAAIGILVTITNKRAEKNAKLREERTERHAKLREEQNMLSLRMMDATLQLSVVSSNALTGGHNNGNVERAREAAQKVAEDYDNFMRSITAHEVGK